MRTRGPAIRSLRHAVLGVLAVLVLASAGTASVEGGGPHSRPKPFVSNGWAAGALPDTFRVQVFATTQRGAAREIRSDIRQWWTDVRGQMPSEVFGERPELTIEHAEPYYRVHVGAFANRSTAQRVRSVLQREYPDAFIVERGTAEGEPAPGGGEQAKGDRAAEKPPRTAEEDQPPARPFRLQLFADAEREVVLTARSGAYSWWRHVDRETREDVFPDGPRFAVTRDGEYHQLLMGRFDTREHARRARSFVSERYPDAFVVQTGPSTAERPAAQTDAPPDSFTLDADQRPRAEGNLPPEGTEVSPSRAWASIRDAANLYDRLHRDSTYSMARIADIFDLNCSPVVPEAARARALDEEASHFNRNVGVDLEARYGQRSAPGTDDFAGSLSGTYVGLDWNLLSQGLFGNRQRSSLLETQSEVARLTGELSRIQRTETCRARRVQSTMRRMIPALLETRIELGVYRMRLLRRAYLEGEALLDTYLLAKAGVREARRRLEALRENVHSENEPETLQAFPPLVELDFESLADANLGDSLREEIGEAERRALSIRDDAALNTRLSVFGRYSTTRTLENRDFEFGLRFSQPLFGKLLGNDGVAEEERAELRRRQEELALVEQRENLQTVHRRFQEDEARAVRAHYRAASRRERVRRRLGERNVRANDRLHDALADAESLLAAVIEKALAYGEVYEEVGRAFSAAREPFSTRYLRVHPVARYDRRGRVGRRSVYVWSQTFRARSNEFLIELAQARKIERFIVSVGHNTPVDKLRDLQARARENDLAVELLLAPNHWVRPGGLERARTRMQNLDLQGGALHLDVEPHMLVDFDAREHEYLRRYLEVLRLARQTIGEDSELVVSVPLFWPSWVYQDISTIVDRVHFMAYGKEETHERAGSVLEVARHFAPEQRVVALRPADFANPWKLDQSISTLQKVVGTDRFALHDLESFLEFISDVP